MSEVNVQKSAGCNEIKINVKPVPVNPVVVENSYRGIDYNVLKNRPKIEGNELIGDKTAKELLGFDKTDMDATVAVAQGAKEVATAANAKSQEAVDIANTAKETADAVDAKATKAMTDSSAALAKATEAKNTADSYQGQITTIKNDVDDLGDQVAAIESKIPAEASASNQLADKEFVTEKTDELAADITALDADVQNINLIKWVDTLPTTGDTKYLYAVAREEVDKDGNKIAALYLWDGTEWRGAGAFSLNIDPDTLATKTEVADNYLPKQNPVVSGILSVRPTMELRNTQNGNFIKFSMSDIVYIGGKGQKNDIGFPENMILRRAFKGTYNDYILWTSNKAVANGVASLDEKAKIPVNQLPDTVINTTDDGIKGDYCTTYGIIDAPNGILTNPSGMEVVLKQGVVLQLAGQDIKTTISGDMAHTITSTTDCDLFYVSGTTSLMEVAQIVWSRIEPDNGQAGVLAWWNPDNKKWKFKSNDTGNVWAEAVATPVAHIHTNGTTITRIDHIGYRVLDDEIYALKREMNTALTGKANTDLSNIPVGYDYVIESKFPTADDPSWYRKYKSGWLEQGGTIDTANITVTFPKPFADTNYTLIGPGFYIVNVGAQQETKTTTGFTTTSNTNITGTHYWEAKGMGAN